jgi:hypothetical protein
MLICPLLLSLQLHLLRKDENKFNNAIMEVSHSEVSRESKMLSILVSLTLHTINDALLPRFCINILWISEIIIPFRCILVQSHLSFRLLSRNVKVKIKKYIILPVVLYGCETWSLELREEGV